jgi:hypothetical protein
MLTRPSCVAHACRELLSPFAIVLWCAAILCFIAFVVQAKEGQATPGMARYCCAAPLPLA